MPYPDMPPMISSSLGELYLLVEDNTMPGAAATEMNAMESSDSMSVPPPPPYEQECASFVLRHELKEMALYGFVNNEEQMTSLKYTVEMKTAADHYQPGEILRKFQEQEAHKKAAEVYHDTLRDNLAQEHQNAASELFNKLIERKDKELSDVMKGYPIFNELTEKKTEKLGLDVSINSKEKDIKDLLAYVHELNQNQHMKDERTQIIGMLVGVHALKTQVQEEKVQLENVDTELKELTHEAEKVLSDAQSWRDGWLGWLLEAMNNFDPSNIPPFSKLEYFKPATVPPISFSVSRSLPE